MWSGTVTNEPSRRRYLSLWFPYLPADRLRLNETSSQEQVGSQRHVESQARVRGQARTGPPAGVDAATPLVFVEKTKGTMRLVKADARAMTIGLQPGMTLADARARVPALRAVDIAHEADAAFLGSLALICTSFTPSGGS